MITFYPLKINSLLQDSHVYDEIIEKMKVFVPLYLLAYFVAIVLLATFNETYLRLKERNRKKRDNYDNGGEIKILLECNSEYY